jgi:hypothetical protein
VNVATWRIHEKENENKAKTGQDGRWSKDPIDKQQGQWLQQCAAAMVKLFFCHVTMDSEAGAHKGTSELSRRTSFRGLRMARDKSPAV